MKDCSRFAPLIGAREGELTPGESKALAAHLSSCRTCRAISADFAVTDGLVAEGLAGAAATRDFAPFVDQVMARIAAEEAPHRGLWAWVERHRRAVAAALVPALAAAALIVYVRVEGGARDQIAQLEISSEGEVTTVLQTADGPVVLLEETGS